MVWSVHGAEEEGGKNVEKDKEEEAEEGEDAEVDGEDKVPVPVVEEDRSDGDEESRMSHLDNIDGQWDWVMKQAEGIGEYLDSPDVADILEGAFSNMVGTERSLEGSLSARMGGHSKLSSIMAYVIICSPLALVGYTSFKASRVVSVRQYVLIGNLCNLAFVAIVFAWYLVSGDDPIEMMVVLNARLAVFVQLLIAIQFPFFCALLVIAVLVSVTKKQKMYFIFQIILYCVIAVDYLRRIWKPTLQKQIFENQTIFAYMSYLVILSFMSYLTVRSAKADRNETIVSEVEAVMSNVERNAADVVMEAVDPTSSALNDTDKIN